MKMRQISKKYFCKPCFLITFTMFAWTKMVKLMEEAHLYEDVMNNFDVLWGAKFQQPSFSHSNSKISWIIHAPQMSMMRYAC